MSVPPPIPSTSAFSGMTISAVEVILVALRQTIYNNTFDERQERKLACLLICDAVAVLTAYNLWKEIDQ